MQDLVVLVADKNMESTVQGLLSRPRDFEIEPLSYKILVHPERDPGCFQKGHELLRPMSTRYAYGLVMFDREGSGRDLLRREELEERVTENLARAGWEDRATAVVIDPELEQWVWSDSPEVHKCLGWESQSQDLYAWLGQHGEWPVSAKKPSNPKKAVEKALRFVQKPRSSAMYRQLAERVSFRRCHDPAFVKFCTQLRQWFPRNGE